MTELPAKKAELFKEIKSLIIENDLSITSKQIRKHLQEKFKCSFDEFKKELDLMTADVIHKIRDEAKGKANEDESEGVKKKKIQQKKTGQNKTKKKSKEYSSGDSSDDEYSTGSSATVPTEKASTSSKSAVSKKRTNGQSLKDEQPVLKKKVKLELEEKVVHNGSEDMASVVKRRRTATVKPVKKAPKSIKDEDGRKGNKSAYSKLCYLSSDLTNLVGSKYMKRADVVKWMWTYFKENNLMYPKDKRFVILDEPLKAVFGKDCKKIQAFGMMSKLKFHIKDLKDLDETTRQQAEMDIAKITAEEEDTGPSSSVQKEDMLNTEEKQEDEDVEVPETENIEEENSLMSSSLLNNPEESNLSVVTETMSREEESFSTEMASTVGESDITSSAPPTQSQEVIQSQSSSTQQHQSTGSSSSMQPHQSPGSSSSSSEGSASSDDSSGESSAEDD